VCICFQLQTTLTSSECRQIRQDVAVRPQRIRCVALADRIRRINKAHIACNNDRTLVCLWPIALRFVGQSYNQCHPPTSCYAVELAVGSIRACRPIPRDATIHRRVVAVGLGEGGAAAHVGLQTMGESCTCRCVLHPPFTTLSSTHRQRREAHGRCVHNEAVRCECKHLGQRGARK
jgi:hypothetical protein